jgi:hypothetical protein
VGDSFTGADIMLSFVAEYAGRVIGATPFRWTVLGLRLDFLFAESFRN